MKKCDIFKDLILTDYIDGELDKNNKASIESHLFECDECRAFLKEVKDKAGLPFQKVLRQPVPSELWDAIKQNIEQEIPVTAPLDVFIDKLKGLFVFPRLVPIFASLVLMLLVGTVTWNTMQIRQTQDKDQAEYLVSLLSPTSILAPSGNNDPATQIEHYFL